MKLETPRSRREHAGRVRIPKIAHASESLALAVNSPVIGQPDRLFLSTDHVDRHNKVRLKSAVGYIAPKDMLFEIMKALVSRIAYE